MWVLLQPTEYILAEVLCVASQSGSVLVENSNEAVVMVLYLLVYWNTTGCPKLT